MVKIRDIFFPRTAKCIACGDIYGQEEDWLCPSCSLALEKSACGSFPARRGIDHAYACYEYTGPARSMVLSLKYGAVRSLAPVMGKRMADAVRSGRIPKCDAVTSVPMPRMRRMRRGIDHTRELARAFCAETGWAWEELLVRRKAGRRQASLSHEQREENARGAFAASEGAKGRVVLVIDDVYTTGSTALACARALKKAGAKGVCFVCFAKTPAAGGRDGKKRARFRMKKPGGGEKP